MTESQTTATQAPGVATGPKIWPVELLRERLLMADAQMRLLALAMCAQTGAPVDGCVDEIVRSAELAKEDATLLHLVAVALGCVKPAAMTTAAYDLLGNLLDAKYADPVRIFAAHALFRLKTVPTSAFNGLSAMLIHQDSGARQIALHALSLVGRAAAAPITQLVTTTPPEHWSTEALAALAQSTGDSADNQRAVEQYLMRTLPSAAVLPTGIAGYTALAKMKPNGAAATVLARIATTATEPAQWRAALTALSTLGEAAHSVAAELARSLMVMDSPEREEAVCRVLVGLRVDAADVPLPRVTQRIESGPERSAAAHCMLLTLHAKQFAAGVKALRARYETASAALKPALERTHLTLAGVELGGVAAQRS